MTEVSISRGPDSRKTRKFTTKTFKDWKSFAEYAGKPKFGEKEGECFLQGTLKSPDPKQKPNGKTSYSNRYIENVEAMHIIAFDVDDDQEPGVIIETLRERGLAFGAYSSFSDSPDHRKTRIVVRLVEPFQISGDLKTDKLRWRRIYVGVADDLGIEIDKACLDLTRLFFTARYPEGIDPDTRLFDWEDGEGLDVTAWVDRAESGEFDHLLPKKPTLDKLTHQKERVAGDDPKIEGVNLVQWAAITEGKLLLNDVVCMNDNGDILSQDEDKSEVICPFDDEHESCPGERTTGFFVSNPSEDHPSFGAYCCHASCSRRDRLDFLRGLIERGDVTFDELKDPTCYQDGESWDEKKKAELNNCLSRDSGLPAPFFLDKKTQRVMKRLASEDRGPLTVCGMIKPIATIRNELDTGYGTLVVIQTRDGIEKEVTLKASMKPGDAATILRDSGLQVFASQGAEAAFKELIAAINPGRVIIEATRPSFHDDNKVFITPLGEVIRKSNDEDKTEWRLNDSIRLKAESRGTLEDWREHVAKPCFAEKEYLPHFGLGLLTGLVGPLIHLLEMDTCMVNLSGPTSSGKTSALKVQASVWGSLKGKESLRFEARGTSNAMEALIERGNGISVGLDELAHAKDVGGLIFAIASGQGNNRMKTDGSELRHTRRWRTFVLMSGEKSIREYVEGDGKQFLGGMATRCADVSVANLKKHPTPSMIDDILSNAQLYNGTAGPAFVRQLLDQDTTELKTRLDELSEQLAGEKASGAERRANLPFALMALAGEIAVKAKILSSDTDYMSCVKWALNEAAHSMAAQSLDTIEESIKAVFKFIAANMDGRIVRLSNDGTEEHTPVWGAAGWYNPNKGIVYLLWDDFTAQCTTDASAVAKELLKRELCLPRKKGDRQGPYHMKLPNRPDAKHIRIKHDFEEAVETESTDGNRVFNGAYHGGYEAN